MKARSAKIAKAARSPDDTRTAGIPHFATFVLRAFAPLRDFVLQDFAVQDFMLQNMILIIAYGNPLREDDGAGLVLAEKLDTLLRRLAIEVHRIETHQLLPELAAEIAADQPAAVVFVDTCVVTTHQEHVSIQPVLADDVSSPSLGHHLTPSAVLSYTGALFDTAPPPAWLVTVPGWQFDFSETLSTRSQEAISFALNDPHSQLRRLVIQLQQIQPIRHNDVP